MISEILGKTVLVALISALLVFVSLNTLALEYPAYDKVFDPTLIEYYSMFDSRPQSYWYKIYFVLLLMISILFAFIKVPSFRLNWFNSVATFVDLKIQRTIPALVSNAAIFVPFTITVALGLILAAYFNLGNVRVFLALGIAVLYLLVAFVLVSASQMKPHLLAAVLFSLLLVMILPVFDPIVLMYPSLQILSISDYHYASLVGSAYQLDAGLTWFDEVVPRYGMIVPLFVLFLHKLGVDSTFIAVNYIVVIIQCVGFGLALWLCISRAKNENALGTDRTLFIWVCLLTFLIIVGGYLTPFSSNFVVPNQTFIRFLPLLFCIGILALFDQQSSFVLAFKIGFFSGFTVLYSPELGLVCSAGIFFGWLVQQRQERFMNGPVFQLASGVFGVITSFVAFYLAYWAIFGAGIINPFAYLEFILLFGGGFGGLELSFDLRFAVILFHSSLIFAWSCIFLVTGKNARSPFEAGVATCILLWLMYYVNRPAPQNLWSIYLLYAFLVIPLLAQYWKKPGVLLLLVFVFIGKPAEVVLADYKGLIRTAKQNQSFVTCQNLVRLPDDQCAEFSERMVQIKAILSEHPDALWMTHFPLLTALATKTIPPSNFIDQFVPNITLERQSKYVEEIKQINPSILVIDRIADDARRILFERFAQNAGYHSCETSYGTWDIFKTSC